jgi:hypothetical protein
MKIFKISYSQNLFRHQNIRLLSNFFTLVGQENNTRNTSFVF